MSLDINLAPIHSQTLVFNILIISIRIIILHTMIVTDLAMTNTIKNLLQNQFILLLAHIILLHPLVVHINIIVVPANARPAIITPFSDNINPHIVFLLNHVLICTEIDHALTQKNTLIISISILLILLNNPRHPNPSPLSPSSTPIMLTLLQLPLGLSNYTFSNHLKTPPYFQD